MKATIDIPEEIYRRVKAKSAAEGRRIREVTVSLYRSWLSGESLSAGNATMPEGIPTVRAEDLSRFETSESLHRAFPRGYRLLGPLISIRGNAPPLLASRVAEESDGMDREEIESHGLPR